MLKRLVIVLAAAALLLVLGMGCSSGDNAASSTPTGGSPTATKSQQPLNIVSISPQAGPYQPYGDIQVNVLQMMVDEWNASGGIAGRQAKLTVHNDNGDQQLGLQLVEQSISQEKADWIAPQFDVEESGALMKDNKVLGAGWGCSPTQQVKSNFPYYFNATDPYSTASDALLRYLTIGLGAKKIAYLDVGDFYSPGFTKEFTAEAKNYNVQVTSETIASDATDTTPQLIKLRDSNPDVLVLVALPPISGQVLKDRTKIGWDIPVVGDNGTGSIGLTALVGADNLKGVSILTYKSGTLDKNGKVPQNLQDFLTKVKAKIGGSPPFPFWDYVMVHDFAETIKVGTEGANGSTDAQTVSTYLEGLDAKPLSPSPFLLGKMNFTADLHCANDIADFAIGRADVPLQDGFYTWAADIP